MEEKRGIETEENKTKARKKKLHRKIFMPCGQLQRFRAFYFEKTFDSVILRQ